MREFPKLKKDQAAILRADKNTGHVLDDHFEIAINDKQDVYTVFDSLEDAINFSKELINQCYNIEIVIYDWEKRVLHLIN